MPARHVSAHPRAHLPAHRAAALLACSLAFGGAPAVAHDTWFETLPDAAPGEVHLALGTGNRFPRHEFTVGAASLQRQGCRANVPGASGVPLQALRDSTTRLELGARVPSPAGAAITCWAQQQAFEVEIAPATVEVYFNDIHATAQVRAAWADMQARGVTWKERYTKHARIELAGRGTPATSPVASGMGMDVLMASGLQAAQAGDTLVFQVLRDGAPLPGLAVELRSDLSPVGLWGETDAQGRVRFRPPIAAQWILRGTDLRLSTRVPDTWESRFVTLAFSVGERR
ncbi:MAG: DUF4198 domain-containing protein [Rhizobacter sp.]|nr:DUF4198 domain-containing protein [Rhizobacter sp.]